MDGSVILQRLGARRRVLLLQGPCGPFFARLASFLEANGRSVTKVNFNAGDLLFYRRRDAIDYKGTLTEWRDWLVRLMVIEKTDAIMLFGDSRPLHRVAVQVGRQHGVPVLVFEEGYLRPGYVTLELGGVNAKSPLPALFRRGIPDQPPHTPAGIGALAARFTLGLTDVPRPAKGRVARVSTRPAGSGRRWREYLAMSSQATVYTIAMRLGRTAFPAYQHHKPFRLHTETIAGLVSAWRKIVYRIEDGQVRRRLSGDLHDRFFVVPLQLFNDSQLTRHSRFAGTDEFIETVMRSFAYHAETEHHLVYKHHPMDRGHRHYGRLIRELSIRFGVTDRVHYVHDVRLPTMFRDALGAVTVNSTAGLSALYHGTPVICLGDCLYDLPGLTHADGLERFWTHPQPPVAAEVSRLRAMMLSQALVRGSFYSGRLVGGTEWTVVTDGRHGQETRSLTTD